MFLFQISKEHIDLAKAEIESLLNCSLNELNSSYYLTEKINENLLSRLAYTNFVYQVLDVKKDFSELNFNIKNSYKINVVNLSSEKINSKEIIDKIYANLKNPIVDLENSDNIYDVIFTEEEVYFTRQIFQNTDSPSSRRAHLRESLHPTSLHPKQARAMLNLTVKEEFLDPFCGSGGILVEGALMGLKTHGSDISQIMINRSKENLKDLDVKLKVQDALTLEKPVEAIVTDFPFGKNSFTSDKIDSLFRKFVLVAQKITRKIVVGHLDSLDVQKLIKNTSWKLESSFEIYVHKSMTRKITKLVL